MSAVHGLRLEDGDHRHPGDLLGRPDLSISPLFQRLHQGSHRRGEPVLETFYVAPKALSKEQVGPT